MGKRHHHPNRPPFVFFVVSIFFDTVMRHVHRSRTKTAQPSLSQWLYRALAGETQAADSAQPRFQLRIRLRGNNLHILYESQKTPQQDVLVPRLVEALQSNPQRFAQLTQGAKAPIYKLMLYGRPTGQQNPVWVEPFDLGQLLRPNENGENTAIPLGGPAQVIANETLARTGDPDAIARYLSENFSYLGVSIKVVIKKLPQVKPSPDPDEPAANKRLWVICSCDYSPDASLLAEPIAQKLRDLQLKGFREAVIRSQVSGETTPDWVLQIDLTRPQVMLYDWARWGDTEALSRLIDQAVQLQNLQGGAILKDSTLHVFCNFPIGQSEEKVDREVVIQTVGPLLEKIAPQGITAATVYGVRSRKYSLNLDEAPIWIEWLNLPASRDPERAISTTQLAKQHNPEALTFLLQRLLNPELDTRLATGGYGVKLCYKDRRLHIMTEGLICPDQAEVVPLLEDFLQELAIPNLLGVRIYGRRAGQSQPVWHHGFELREPPLKSKAATLNPIATPTPATTGVAIAPEKTSNISWTDIAASYVSDFCCSTGLFVPFDQDRTANLTRSTPLSRSRRSTSRQSRHLKTAIALGVAGVAIATQMDWLTGRWLDHQSQIPSTATSPLENSFTVPAQAAPSEEIVLPNTTPNDPTFNAEQFTNRETDSATTAAILAEARASNPTFNNRLLDEKLALYQERLRTQGVPDVLIVGSSRAMRGIDPTTLQIALAQQGYKDVEIFNFGINGATAQVVDLILRRILTPEQLPDLIIWADGARAFNSGRPDRTYEAIVSSVGYQQLQENRDLVATTDIPNTSKSWLTQLDNQVADTYNNIDQSLNEGLASILDTYNRRTQVKALLRQTWGDWLPQPEVDPEQAAMLAELTYTEEIDIDGFLPLAVRFDPQTYYERHPRVKGAYDSDYESFSLQGSQAESLQAVTQFLSDRNINLVLINLPLTDDYFDEVRLSHEQEFVAYLQSQAAQTPLIFINWGQQWTTQHDLYSDPSHLNRYGAYQVSTTLAQNPAIPWPR